jgi:ubiquinol-cytochrome c reductase cytochrome b subunit
MTERTSSPPSLFTKGRQWIEERLDIDELMGTALHVEIPQGVRTYFLGGMTLFFLGVQVVTGILLALYYRASSQNAYESILFIMNNVRFGWLIRSIHAWSANLMIVACLLLITMGFGFTGYLLPWDQRAFWATTVGTEIAGAVPLVGDPLLRFLRAGSDVSGLTLSRFYGIHTLVLPAGVVLFVGIHLLLIHEQGLAARPGTPAADEEADT